MPGMADGQQTMVLVERCVYWFRGAYWLRGVCTCTWSSSVTGSEVLVDLSVIRFLRVGRGRALDKSVGEKQ